MRTRRAGFTLIELLVVIAIIAILAAILFPVFANAKERGRQNHCLNNLKQLSMGIRQYCDDQDGRMPPALARNGICDWTGNWECGNLLRTRVSDGALFKSGYVRSAKAYACPTDASVKNARGEKWPFSYTMNFEMGSDFLVPPGHPTDPRRSMHLDAESAGRASKILMLIHESRMSINDGYCAWINGGDIPSELHYDGTTVSYVDGHARWASYKDLMAARRERVVWLGNTRKGVYLKAGGGAKGDMALWGQDFTRFD